VIDARDLIEAVASDQFDVLYQPVIELQTGRITKAEALIRWRHPTLGHLGPGEFIAQAERWGLIGDVGAWVFRRAISDLGALRQDYPDFKLSVNVSPLQIEGGSLSEALLRQWLHACDVPASSLIAEITEACALSDSDANREAIARLRALGVKLAIDDFGMGQSALNSLIRFPCDFIKLDRVFVQAAVDDRARRAVTRLIVEMAHELGMSVIAEGVETQDDLTYVVSLGCEHAQGYFWSAGVSLAALRAALDTQARDAGA
jgi:EAL domain-containing protein (putative c-di-GMP-specific phosphodiesterase class I)